MSLRLKPVNRFMPALIWIFSVSGLFQKAASLKHNSFISFIRYYFLLKIIPDLTTIISHPRVYQNRSFLDCLFLVF